jgi:hypothetical protein
MFGDGTLILEASDGQQHRWLDFEYPSQSTTPSVAYNRESIDFHL